MIAEIDRNTRFVPVFLVVCFAFSWGLWGLIILSSHGVLPFRVPLNPYGSFGPAVAALIVAGLQGGRSGVRSLLGSLFHGRMALKWYLFSLLSMAGLALIAALLFMWFQGKGLTLHLNEWYLVFPIALLIMILGGPLGEEIGWRGFLLPALQRRYNSLVCAFIIAVFWFLWHLPLFWMEGSSQYKMPLPPYLLWILIMSVLFIWLYNKTRGSLLQAVLYHTGVNVTYFCIPYVLPEADASKSFHYLFMGTAGVLAIGLIAMEGKDLGKANG